MKDHYPNCGFSGQRYNSHLSAHRVSKDRKTDDCKTKTSMNFGSFVVAFHARNLKLEVLTNIKKS